MTCNRLSRKNRGIALIILIIIIVVVGIILSATVSFTAQSLRLANQRAYEFQSQMSAQAGLMLAANRVLSSGTYVSTEGLVVGMQNFKVGFAGQNSTAVNWVYLDPSATNNISNNKQVTGWRITNTDPNNAYMIGRALLTWTPTNRTLTQLVLNGVIVWSGNAPSGTLIAITPGMNIPANTTRSNNTATFNSSMNNYHVSVALTFYDSTVVSDEVFPASPPIIPTPGKPNTIIATGKELSGSTVIMRQTMLASFEVVSGVLNIYKYNETSEHLMP